MNPIHLTQLRCVRPSQFFNQLNKSVLKQTCERRASVFGDSTSEREFTLLCCSCKYTLCYCTKHCSVSNWFTWALYIFFMAAVLQHMVCHDCTTGHSMLVSTGAKSPAQLDFDLTIFYIASFVHTKTPFIYARKHVNSSLFTPVSCCTNWLWVK